MTLPPDPVDKATAEELAIAKAAWLNAPPHLTTVGELIEHTLNAVLARRSQGEADAVRAEREACAKTADEWSDAGDTSSLIPSAAKAMRASAITGQHIATAIRARSGKAKGAEG